MEAVVLINERLLWGAPMLLLYCFVGVLYTVKLKGAQVFNFHQILKKTLFGKSKTSSSGISPFSTFVSALGTTLGAGNIIAVGTAVAMGGAGAVFWIWMSGLLGMIICYAENYLGISYRNKADNKRDKCVPFVYIRKAYKNGKIAAVLTSVYAASCILASFGMGNMAQINSASTALYDGAGVPLWATGTAAAVFVFYAAKGGLKRISAFNLKLIPLFSFLYIGISICIIIINYDNIIPCLTKIISEAFSLEAVSGGSVGTVMLESMKWGVKRGVFSSETGLGTSVFIHSNSTEKDPETQGMWAMLQVFIDTIIMCSMTAIVILVTNSVSVSGSGVDLPYIAFSSLLGNFSGIFIGVCIFVFACATLCGWYVYGKSCMQYLFGKRFSRLYLIFFTCLAFIGSVLKANAVWELSDLFNGILAAIHLPALFLLHKEVYFKK